MNEKSKTQAVKKFVRKHKTAIAVVTTAAICITINRMALKQHDNFLKERGLYDEFYTPEAEF